MKQSLAIDTGAGLKQLAVTIGTGTWAALAMYAADRFALINACEVKIIHEKTPWGRLTGGLKCTHPSWMKLWVWELVPDDIDEVLLFDADVYPVRPCLYDLGRMGREAGVAILAVPDRIGTRTVQSEALLYGIPPARYFNAGLLWMSRAAVPALRRAQARHPAYGSWLEQTALNAAVIETEVRLALVDERFNRHVPIAGGEVGDDAVNLHFAGWKKPEAILEAMRRLEG